MSEKLYLVGVGDVYAYDTTTGDLLFKSKTEIENSIAISATAKEIRGGAGDQLLYIYYTGAKFAITLKDAQFSLPMIARACGSNITTNNDLWATESIALGTGGVGTLTGTPLQSPDSSAVYAWVTDGNDNDTKVTVSGNTFTLPGGVSGQPVCVRYYKNNPAAKQVTVSANIVPGIVRLVIEGTLASNAQGTGVAGIAQIEVGRAQFDGSDTLTLQSNGVSQTALKMNALSYTSTAGGCVTAGVYATITQVINSANWYDDVQFLAVADDTITLTSTNSTSQLTVYAVPSTGSAFLAPMADLTFTSSTPADVTVSSTGLLTRVAAGSSTVSIKITNKQAVTTAVNVTAS